MPEGAEFKLRAKLEIDDASIKALAKKLSSGLGFDLGGGGKGGGGGGGGGTTKNLLGMSGGQMNAMVKGLGSFGKIGQMAATTFGGAGKVAGLLGGAAGAGGAGGGAAAGAAAGSIAPGVGTAIGAAVGVVIGDVIMPVLKEISNMLKEASPMLGAVADLTKTMVNMILKPFADAFAMFLLPIIVWLYKYMIIPFYQYVYPAMMKLVKLVEPIAPYLAAGFAVVGTLLLAVGAIVAIYIGLLLLPLLVVVATLGAIVLGIEWLANNFVNILAAIGNAVIQIAGVFVTGLEMLGRGVMKLGSVIGNGLEKIGGFIVGRITVRLGEMINTIVGIGTLFTSGLDALGTFFSDLFSTMKNALLTGFREYIGNLATQFRSILNPVGSVLLTVKGIINTVKSTMANVYNVIKNTIVATLNTIKTVANTISDTITKVKDAIKDLSGGVLSPLSPKGMSGGGGGGSGGGGGGGGAGSNYTVWMTQNIYGTQDPRETADRSSRDTAERLGALFR